MPNPILSTIDDMIGAGGVIPTSPTNVTIYNSRVIMRLIGGSVPHDELLAPLDRVLSSFSSWGVEVSVANTWIPLIPYSSTLDVLGTNSSGSFVVRNTELDNGNYSGVLHVVYKATSQGELKWDLEFTPATSGRYRLAYDFHDLESTASLSAPLKKFDMRFGASNYTISWNDVPESLNVTTSLTPGQFTLFIDLRNISGGLTTRVDPGVVDTSYSSNSISYTFQRHVFFEPKASYFWAFYYDGQYIRYEENGREYYREVKNTQYLSATRFNRSQLLKYADAVGTENLSYDLYVDSIDNVSKPFRFLLNQYGVDYRILPYVPVG